MAYTQALCDELRIEEHLCTLVLSADEEGLVAKAATELGHFATFSGFLAALAFASLMILITNPPESKDNEAAAHRGNAFTISMFSLVIVFTLLLLSTFMFIPITGSSFRPEQDVGFLITDMILALAVCELFLSLSWFFVAYRLAMAARQAAIVTFYFVIFVTMLNASAVLTNVAENLSAYYPKEITGEMPIYAALANVGVPIVFAFLARVTLHHRLPIQVWWVWIRYILYTSMVFALVLICCYVYLFSGLWERAVLPFPTESGMLFAIGLGLVLGSCVLALPRWQRETT